MRDANMIVRDRQLAVRREMERRDISLKAVACDAKIEYPTTVSYFPGGSEREPATLNLAGLYMILRGKALPLDLVSMLLPDGFAVVAVPEGINHDEMETVCREYLAAKGKAHHPDSPGGREISTCEQAMLDAKVTHMVARS